MQQYYGKQTKAEINVVGVAVAVVVTLVFLFTFLYKKYETFYSQRA